MSLLDRIAPDVVAAALDGYEEPEVAKGIGDLDALDFSSYATDEDLIAALAAGYKAGAKDTAGIVGLDLTNPSEPAMRYAQDRAAELIGMKRHPTTGDLYVNPNPRWAITETVRDDAKALVEAAVKEGWSYSDLSAGLQDMFEPWRAEMIARTELALSYNGAASDIYTEFGQDFVELLDGDGCLPHGHDDGAEEPDGTVGLVDLERQANGQVWPVSAIVQYIIGHPHCVRAFVAYEPPAKGESE